MVQYPQNTSQHTWNGWSTISAQTSSSFTLWFTGLPGTGKTTLAEMIKQTLVRRGYKVEIIDHQSLSNWLRKELRIEEEFLEDDYQTLSYDMFVTYLCKHFARDGIISIATSVSPFADTRAYARDQIKRFFEVHARCESQIRYRRLAQLEKTYHPVDRFYQPPKKAELTINTTRELPEQCTWRIISKLEQSGYIAPLWEQPPISDEFEVIKTRLQALGYLE